MSEQQEKTALVTGANVGIGRATAFGLARKGLHVWIAARSPAKAEPVLEQLRAQFPHLRFKFLQLDLSDLKGVKRSAQTFLESGSPLDVLVNNAGLASTLGTTADGYEMTIGTNALGPFLFTQQLLPRLQEASQGRVVNVASKVHYSAKVDWSVVERPSTSVLEIQPRYAFSKLLNVVHARRLAQLEAKTRVTTYALHPGVVASDIWHAIPQPFRWVAKQFMLTVEEGAKTSIYCATDAELSGQTGHYYDSCASRRPHRLLDDEAFVQSTYDRMQEYVDRALRR